MTEVNKETRLLKMYTIEQNNNRHQKYSASQSQKLTKFLLRIADLFRQNKIRVMYAADRVEPETFNKL